MRRAHVWSWQDSLAVLSICAALAGCSSGLRTAVHEGPDHNVYLDWVADESFRASHPASLSPTTLHRTLRGLLLQNQKGLFDRLSGEGPEPTRVFSDQEVDLLLPHLIAALSQATPEERVLFEMVYPHALGSNRTRATLYVQGDLIFVTLTQYARSSGRPDIRYVENRHAPDTIGLADSTLLFAPPEALQVQQSRQQAATPTLAINYPQLERLPDILGKGEAAGRPRPTGGSIRPSGRQDVPETESGDARLQGLEEQVTKQEEELEQLKKELRELQGERRD